MLVVGHYLSWVKTERVPVCWGKDTDKIAEDGIPIYGNIEPHCHDFEEFPSHASCIEVEAQHRQHLVARRPKKTSISFSGNYSIVMAPLSSGHHDSLRQP